MRERESVVQQPSSVAGVGWTLDRAVVVVYSKPVRCRDARCSTVRPPQNETKSVDPDNTAELFAGTTACHELAAGFLGSFGVPYDVVGGNHDLEGIDEFQTDRAVRARARARGRESASVRERANERARERASVRACESASASASARESERASVRACVRASVRAC